MPITPDLNHKRGYIGKIRQYVREGRSLFDLQNSMTYLPDLSRAIEYLTHSNPPFTGTYNMVNPRSLSPLDVAKLCHEKLGDPEPKVLSYEEIRKTIACDRSNCLLSCKKLRKTGFELDPITKIMDQIIK
jgi:dTDP-4-dehydrorhamnose reductase